MIEKRATVQPVELRAEGDSPPSISGYAAVFYREGDPTTQYQLWPGAFERVTRTAFDEALQRGDDVRGLFNHDPNQVLGRLKAGTLSLSVDDVGLRYTITPAATTLYRDVAEMIRRGDVDGSSFAFTVVGEETWYRDENDNEIRELKNVKLFDVSPVTYPAYAAATSEARSARDRWAGAREAVEAERIQREAFLRKLELTRLTIKR